MLSIVLISKLNLCVALSLCDHYCNPNLILKHSLFCKYICHDLGVEFNIIQDLKEDNYILSNEVYFLNSFYSTSNHSVNTVIIDRNKTESNIIYNNNIVSQNTLEYNKKFFEPFLTLYAMQFVWSLMLILFP